MASFEDLQFDWSTLCQECTDCWTQEDLQLAAELGKTLLERNKELETSLKQHQNIIEDQTQEIEYLTKQTVALREVNDSRLRIYEQLEVSIHDLERANHRLTLDASSDKKQIKSLCANVDSLESRCEEFQTTVELLTRELEAYKRKCEKVERTEEKTPSIRRDIQDASQDKQVQCDSTSQTSPQCHTTTSTSPIKPPLSSTDVCDSVLSESDKEQLLLQHRDCETRSAREKRRNEELEEQMAALVQEIQQQLEEIQLLKASRRDEDMKSMHDELNTLDEVRQGQLCARCLRNVDDRLGPDDMSILDTEDEDDDNMSMMDALIGETRYRSSVSLNIQQDVSAQSNNLYRDLVEKYEALLAVNRNHSHHKPANNCLSLHEELQMSGDFNNLHGKDTDEESGHGDSYNQIKSNSKDRKNFSQTPTDFSEAETSSSGFSDETSNKSTQTDGRPGSFLCTIADGEDCKFSIYDDASPIDSRFRNRPEYRELFKEIFTVLKKAAENKDEGEDLPLLDDCTPIVCVPKVPPVTPATEEFPGGDFTDDNQSVISSAMSDISTKSNEPATVVENVVPQIETEPKTIKQKPEEDVKEEINKVVPKEEIPVLTPYKREPLEYLSVSVNVRKKSSAKKNNKKQFVERSDSPVLPLSPRINYLSGNNSGRKRKEQRPNTITDNGSTQVWNGSTLQFWSSNRNAPSPTPSQNSGKSARYEKNWEFKPSMASQDLNKLKRLDLSYAEVLRNADNKKREVFGKSVVRRK